VLLFIINKRVILVMSSVNVRDPIFEGPASMTLRTI
jgi:hypothetical protein